MLIIFLVVMLGDFPFLMFGKLGTFDTLKECRAYIAKEAPERLRPKLECIQVVSPEVKEAATGDGKDHG